MWIVVFIPEVGRQGISIVSLALLGRWVSRLNVRDVDKLLDRHSLEGKTSDNPHLTGGLDADAIVSAHMNDHKKSDKKCAICRTH